MPNSAGAGGPGEGNRNRCWCLYGAPIRERSAQRFYGFLKFINLTPIRTRVVFNFFPFPEGRNAADLARLWSCCRMRLARMTAKPA